MKLNLPLKVLLQILQEYNRLFADCECFRRIWVLKLLTRAWLSPQILHKCSLILECVSKWDFNWFDCAKRLKIWMIVLMSHRQIMQSECPTWGPFCDWRLRRWLYGGIIREWTYLSGHWWHTNGKSPLWIRTCRTKFEWSWNIRLQESQTYRFLCTSRMWVFNRTLDVNLISKTMKV